MICALEVPTRIPGTAGVSFDSWEVNLVALKWEGVLRWRDPNLVEDISGGMGASGVSVTQCYFKIHKCMIEESLWIFVVFYLQYNVFHCDCNENR